jgi:hypothetical protein
MAVEERRRIALHRAAAEAWGREVGGTSVELVAPSGHELATRADIQDVLAAMARWTSRRPGRSSDSLSGCAAFAVELRAEGGRRVRGASRSSLSPSVLPRREIVVSNARLNERDERSARGGRPL